MSMDINLIKVKPQNYGARLYLNIIKMIQQIILALLCSYYFPQNHQIPVMTTL